MSQQAFWLFLKMDKRNLFVQMALQCAPGAGGNQGFQPSDYRGKILEGTVFSAAQFRTVCQKAVLLQR